MYNHSSVKKTCKWKINWRKICKDQNFRNSVLVLFLWAESRNFKSVFQGKTGKEVKVSLEISWRMKKTLGCQLSPSPDIFLVGWPLRCLEGMGAVFTSHFPLCSFRQWTGALGPEAEVFLPTPCHFALPWLLWIQHFLASVGQANLTLSHNMAASVYCLHSLTSTFLAQFLTELKDQLYLWGCRMWGKYNTLFIFILLL